MLKFVNDDVYKIYNIDQTAFNLVSGPLQNNFYLNLGNNVNFINGNKNDINIIMNAGGFNNNYNGMQNPSQANNA